MNKVILVGRLTKDPEVRVTQGGKKVASFSVAIDDGKNAEGQKISQYFNCSAWDALAEIIEKFVKKGHRIAIIGKLQNRSWDKPDGTKGYATDISVREMELLTTKAEADQLGQGSDTGYSSPSTNSSQTSSGNSNANEIPEIDIDTINIQMPF